MAAPSVHGHQRAAILLRGCAQLHPLRCAHAEQIETVREHDAGGRTQPQTGPRDVGDGVVALRYHTADVVETVINPGEFFEVARNPMRLAQLSRACDYPWEFG